ncbi:hypothetical protein ACGFX2_19710 [Streptomyces goshikiensis]|uniref:hypothetical protein n=1 Tax=Streptomyces goshikiensis TaxID=1942 RepID=UPI00371BB0FF
MAPDPRQSGEPRWDAHAQRWVWEPAAGAPPAAPQVYGPPPVMPPAPPGQAGQVPAAPAYDPLGPGAPGGPGAQAAPGLPPYTPPGQQPPYVSNPPYLPPVPPGAPLSGGARGRWLTPATAGIAVAAVVIGAGAAWFLARDTDDANRAGEKNGTVASGAPSLPGGTPSDAASPTPGGSASPDSGASGGPSGSPSPSGTGVHETKQDPGGFTIAVPAGWAREEGKDGVFYRSADRSALLQIFRVTEELSPLDTVKGSSSHRRSQTSGYEEIRVGTVPGGSGAAELVYEYDNAESHGRRRCVERVLFGPDGSKWAVLTAGPAGEWAATQDHHAAALAAFRPGG